MTEAPSNTTPRSRLPAQLEQRVMFLLAQYTAHTVHFSDENLKNVVTEAVDQALNELQLAVSNPPLHNHYRKTLLDELLGLGPIEDLLKDDSISEIMVNHYREVYIERDGKLIHHPLTFSSEQALRNIVERIVAPLGRRIDDASPIVDARLPDGSRVNAVIPPLALYGTALTIRKFPQQALDATALLTSGTLDKNLLNDLSQSVINGKNILISGGTGAGKTTLLNLLSAYIPTTSRIITIEEAAELKLNHPHVLRLEARPANSEGKGEVTIRELLRNALRMRPDRIIIGECRGAEAFDMLQAMNTGHTGSLTTLHANSPNDALTRLETMVMMAGLPLPLTAIRAQIASAIDLVIQIKRGANGQRIVSEMRAVKGIQQNMLHTEVLYRREH